MNITINGQAQSVNNGLNLHDVIQTIITDSSRVIAEHNGLIIKKDNWYSTAVQDGDAIELVSFVGGG